MYLSTGSKQVLPINITISHYAEQIIFAMPVRRHKDAQRPYPSRDISHQAKLAMDILRQGSYAYFETIKKNQWELIAPEHPNERNSP